MNLSDINFDEIKPEAFEPIPNGRYEVEIVSSEQKLTKKAEASGNAQDGTMLCLRLKITCGKFKGRNVFNNLNIFNASEVAQRIGRQRLGEILDALGLTTVNESSELHGRPLVAQLKTKKGGDGYSDREEVVRYAPSKKPADPIWDEPAGGDDTPF